MIKYKFGKNWKSYLSEYFNENSLKEACKSICTFMGVDNFKGKRFIDVGCGSGIMSLAAIQLEAKEVLSIDCDIDSIEATESLKYFNAINSKNFNISKWSIKQDSILNRLDLKHGKFDIVYSWGVLHHTGNLVKALNNVTELVNDNGLIYLSIYNEVGGLFGSRFWKRVKLAYNKSPSLIRYFIELFYIIKKIIFYILQLKNPFKEINNYNKIRGMNFITDIKDWLGGYPYEPATVTKIFKFFKFKGFNLINISTTNRLGCNEYLFRRGN